MTSYDKIPYVSNPFSETHPARMRTTARLFGHAAPDPAACSVLEIGCASGGNLVPLAYLYPGSRFVGIDLSAVQIDLARRFAEGAGVKNLQLLPLSLTDIDASFGSFDYIIAHGVFSWVPPEIQKAMLTLCRDRLSPAGVAYVSFNTLPGWHTRNRIREMMRFHARQFADPMEQVREARAFFKLVAGSPYFDRFSKIGELLKSELNLLADKPDEYVLHDFLEENNHAMYLMDFVALAAEHGLGYLAEGWMNASPLDEGWPEAGKLAECAGGDPVRLEQYADFLRDSAFRRALLCHQGVRPDRTGLVARVCGMHVVSQFRPAGNEGGAFKFVHPRGATLVSDPLVEAALLKLSEVYLRPLPFEEVFRHVCVEVGVPAEHAEAQRASLAAELARFWMVGFLELHADPPHFLAEPGPRPRASAVARFQSLQQAARVTNLRHEPVQLDDRGRRLLELCDGSCTDDDLVQALRSIFSPTEEPAIHTWLRPVLAKLGRAGLIEA